MADPDTCSRGMEYARLAVGLVVGGFAGAAIAYALNRARRVVVVKGPPKKEGEPDNYAVVCTEGRNVVLKESNLEAGVFNAEIKSSDPSRLFAIGEVLKVEASQEMKADA